MKHIPTQSMIQTLKKNISRCNFTINQTSSSCSIVLVFAKIKHTKMFNCIWATMTFKWITDFWESTFFFGTINVNLKCLSYTFTFLFNLIELSTTKAKTYCSINYVFLIVGRPIQLSTYVFWYTICCFWIWPCFSCLVMWKGFFKIRF